MIEEYNQIDFEDVIAGGLKTKYQYIDVEAEGFGLTDAELLFADDNILDQMLSIKKLNPYKHNSIGERERTKIRKMRALVRESAEKNQKRFLKEHKLMLRENELKELSKKSKKHKEEYEKFLQQKDEMIAKIYENQEEEKKKMRKVELEEQINSTLKGNDKVDQKRLESYGLK